MALKLVVAKKEEIPEGAESMYIEQSDGTWRLDVDDAVPKDRLKEFRDNNIQLMKQIEDMNAKLDKYKGIDPEKHKQALEALQKLEDQKMLNDGKIDELVDKRVERMRADFEGQKNSFTKQIEQLTQQNTTLNNELSSTLIDSKIHQAVHSVGVPRNGAMEDILARGHRVFKLVEGKPVPQDASGNTIFGKDGKAPMTFEEWAQGLFESANYLFEGATGGSAHGNANRGGGGAPASKVIQSGDPLAFGRNLEGIAKGKVGVKR